MSEKTALEFTDATLNLVGGCSHASPGCRFCYAQLCAGTQQAAHRIELYEGVTDWVRGKPVFNGNLTVPPPEHPNWLWPLKWPGSKHPVMGPGQPSLIFCGDMADLFHEDRPKAVIDEVVATMTACRHVTQFLTKRADHMAAYFGAPRPPETLRRWKRHFWLGISCESQEWLDARWPAVRPLAESGFVVFICTGPQLGPITMPQDFLKFGPQVWLIASGEQGSRARPMDPDWARALRDQCAAAGVAFFLNQMSRRTPIPHDLFVRQFPAVMENGR